MIIISYEIQKINQISYYLQNCVIWALCINHRRQQLFMRQHRQHQWMVQFPKLTATKLRHCRHVHLLVKFHRQSLQAAPQAILVLQTTCNHTLCHNLNRWSKCTHHQLHTVQFHRHITHCRVICWATMKLKLKMKSSMNLAFIHITIIKWHTWHLKITAAVHLLKMNVSSNHKSFHEISNVHQLSILRWNKNE